MLRIGAVVLTAPIFCQFLLRNEAICVTMTWHKKEGDSHERLSFRVYDWNKGRCMDQTAMQIKGNVNSGILSLMERRIW